MTETDPNALAEEPAPIAYRPLSEFRAFLGNADVHPELPIAWAHFHAAAIEVCYIDNETGNTVTAHTPTLWDAQS